MPRTKAEVLDLFERCNAFPVLQSGCQEQEYIPYNIIAPHEAQAMENHGGQTLQRLAERGGLDWAEILAVLKDKKWQEMGYGPGLSKEGLEKAKKDVLSYVKERNISCGCSLICKIRKEVTK